jgi:WD40 repeat protein
MKHLTLAVLLSLLGIVALHARDAKQSLRVELAQQQRSAGYSLVDTWGSRGEVWVVSVENRTGTKTKAKDFQKLTSQQCSSPEGRYSVFYEHGVWLRDNESRETQQVETEGEFSSQCFSPEGKFVYSTGKTVRIYDLVRKKNIDVGDGSYPTWSPDGKWLGFDAGGHYLLLDLQTGNRKRLFSTKYGAGVDWSPDSRYLTYTKLGGSTGGFLFWGIKCIEPYRVWVWRVEDDAHDWVQQICKPGRSFIWVRNSDLLFEQP